MKRFDCAEALAGVLRFIVRGADNVQNVSSRDKDEE
jgi:hypothetical protein